jgi:hypothetical protein
MPTPEHISSLDFDSVLSGIEMTKELLEETSPMMSNFTLDQNSKSPDPLAAENLSTPDYRVRQSVRQ